MEFDQYRRRVFGSSILNETPKPYVPPTWHPLPSGLEDAILELAEKLEKETKHDPVPKSPS